jgi:hypothetical protein
VGYAHQLRLAMAAKQIMGRAIPAPFSLTKQSLFDNLLT